MTELFDDKNSNQDQGSNSTPDVKTDSNDLLAVIVNDKGEQKFNSVADLVKGYQSSQQFISTLKEEKGQVLTEAEQKAKQLEELAAKLKSQEELEKLLDNASNANTTTPDEPAADVPAGVTAEDVVKIMQQQEQTKVKASNVTLVKKAVEAVKGDLGELCEKAGLPRDLAQQMAETAPEALLSTLGVEAPSAPVNLSGGYNQHDKQDTPPPAKRVMNARKASEVTDEWKRIGKQVEEKYQN